MLPEIATAGDLAWMGASFIMAMTALAFGVLLAAFRRAPWAYVVAGTSVVMLVISPVVAWSLAQSSAAQFGGGPAMVWLVVSPALRVYTLLGAALVATNVTLFVSKR